MILKYLLKVLNVKSL